MVVAVREHIESRVSHVFGKALAVEVRREGEAVEFGSERRREPLADSETGTVEEVEISVRGSHASTVARPYIRWRMKGAVSGGHGPVDWSCTERG